jgi:hypothetical protein
MPCASTRPSTKTLLGRIPNLPSWTETVLESGSNVLSQKSGKMTYKISSPFLSLTIGNKFHGKLAGPNKKWFFP